MCGTRHEYTFLCPLCRRSMNIQFEKDGVLVVDYHDMPPYKQAGVRISGLRCAAEVDGKVVMGLFVRDTFFMLGEMEEEDEQGAD